MSEISEEERKTLAKFLRASLAATGELDDAVNLAGVPPGMTRRQLVEELEQGTALGVRVAADLMAIGPQDHGFGVPILPDVGAEIGDVMPAGDPNAGWIYMGPDDETGEVFYAAPKDETGTFTFNQAAKRAASTGAKVPSQSQLDKMYWNRDKGALAGTFNETGSGPASWYWSSSQLSGDFAWAQRFSDGSQNYGYFKDYDSSLRLVR